MYRGIANWLLERSLRDCELDDIVRGVGRRLVEGGLPIYRLNVGGLVLHPVLGGLDMTWDSTKDLCQSQWVPRSAFGTPEFRNAPYFNMVSNGIRFERHRLDDPSVRGKFPLFERLGKAGVTDYVAMFETYGRHASTAWAGLPPDAEGALFSFATRRVVGFTDREVANLRQLSVSFALAVKMATDQSLAKTLMETYLGKLSGGNVLSGLVEKGDGRVIECALWYSDMRRSTELAAELDIDTYFGTINDYFDCAVGAVLDHGGEVLKLIGDGVMAIFPFEDETRPAFDMCHAAVMAAREAVSRGVLKNAARVDRHLVPIDFGVGLHVGKVMYGNVGTERRLDLTVTGPAANEVDRLEALCKRLSVPVVTSGRFRSFYRGDLVFLGWQEVKGIEDGLDAFTLPEHDPAPLKVVKE